VARNNHSIGNAGEFYVLAQLAQRGYIAGKTDDGQTLIDVIATDPDTLNTVNIQVKTTRDGGQKWVMGVKNRVPYKGLWYVFVSIKDNHQLPDFYVFSSDEVAQSVEARYQYWLNKPKKDGSAREESKMIPRFQPDADALENARDRWDLMFSS